MLRNLEMITDLLEKFLQRWRWRARLQASTSVIFIGAYRQRSDGSFTRCTVSLKSTLFFFGVLLSVRLEFEAQAERD